MLRRRKFGNISSGSSKISLATKIILIKTKVLHTTSSTKNKEGERKNRKDKILTDLKQQIYSK